MRDEARHPTMGKRPGETYKSVVKLPFAKGAQA